MTSWVGDKLFVQLLLWAATWTVKGEMARDVGQLEGNTDPTLRASPSVDLSLLEGMYLGF